MARKLQFKAESKKLLDLMINSIYTHREIFLRELISNASDAIDKLQHKRLEHPDLNIEKSDLVITLEADKEQRILLISDNGIGMTEAELKQNLGTIAHSGSQEFKEALEGNGDASEIIGQFGVGFYSGFMVADKVEVLSKALGSEDAFVFTSTGVDGFTVEPAQRESRGTTIRLFLKENTEDLNFDEYLESFKLRSLVKKYSDYISYPIHWLEEDQEPEVINSMIPLWKRSAKEITDEEYFSFYKDKFSDFEDPLKVIHMKVEGMITFDALLFIPSKVPFNYYSSEYEKGLQLYSKGVFIEGHNKELISDEFSFVRGIVDSADLSLNISREMLQHNRQLQKIANRIQKKVREELTSMLEEDREKYEQFFDAFGMQLKFGLYQSFGMKREELQDLLLFKTSHEDGYATLKEIHERLKEDQKEIYYVSSETVEKGKRVPQSERILDKGFELMVLTQDVDEFVIQILNNYEDIPFKSVNQGEIELDEKELEEIKLKEDEHKELLETIKSKLEGQVDEVKLSTRLQSYPVCLVSGEGLSFEMEKVMAQSPDKSQHLKASRILELNMNHPLFETLINIKDESLLQTFADLLYDQALLIEGLPIESPAEFSKKLAEVMMLATK